MKRTTEGRYEQLVRMNEGLSAIEHLVLPLDPGDPVRVAHRVRSPRSECGDRTRFFFPVLSSL